MTEFCNNTAEAPDAKQPETLHGWDVGWANQEDEKELLDLFFAAFGHTMPVEQWRWKYHNSEPIGSYVREKRCPVAFYGGMPRGIRLLGERGTAVQIGDVMVEPRQRRAFTRHGAFFRAASAFAEGLIGPDKQYLCAYGFPSERHYRLGEHLGLYIRIGELLEAAWPPLPSRLALNVTVSPLQPSQLELLPQLWQSMAEDLIDKVVLERNNAYIQHRFLQHPTVDYMLLLVKQRFTGKPLGLLILRDHGSEGVELIDIVASLKQMPSLISTAQRVTGKLKRHRLFSWLTSSVADALQDTNPQLEDLNVPLGTISWQQKDYLLHTRDQWWLIGGDADSR